AERRSVEGRKWGSPALPSRKSSIQPFCWFTRSGSVAPSCHVSRNDSTSALSGSVPGLSVRKHQRRLSRKAYGHSDTVSATSGHAWRLSAASTPPCASDDLPTPELPTNNGRL